MKRYMSIITLLLSFFFLACPSWGGDIESAQEFFELYVKKSDNFDATIAEMYDDSAVILSTRVYPDGQERKLTLTGVRYKVLIAGSMPLAEQRGDRDIFSDVTFTEEDGGIRILATRHSMLKNYDSPYSQLLALNDDGHLVIIEEISQTQP